MVYLLAETQVPERETKKLTPGMSCVGEGHQATILKTAGAATNDDYSELIDRFLACHLIVWSIKSRKRPQKVIGLLWFWKWRHWWRPLREIEGFFFFECFVGPFGAWADIGMWPDISFKYLYLYLYSSDPILYYSFSRVSPCLVALMVSLFKYCNNVSNHSQSFIRPCRRWNFTQCKIPILWDDWLKLSLWFFFLSVEVFVSIFGTPLYLVQVHLYFEAPGCCGALLWSLCRNLENCRLSLILKSNLTFLDNFQSVSLR